MNTVQLILHIKVEYISYKIISNIFFTHFLNPQLFQKGLSPNKIFKLVVIDSDFNIKLDKLSSGLVAIMQL